MGGGVKISDVVEATLAVVVVGSVAAIAVFDAVTSRPVVIPQELVGFALLVLGSYFRGRSVNGTVAGLTNALQHSVPAEIVKPTVGGG